MLLKYGISACMNNKLLESAQRKDTKLPYCLCKESLKDIGHLTTFVGYVAI